MASETEICNQAIGLVGGEQISNLDENSTAAKLCKVIYPISRDAVMEERDWTFATARRVLTPMVEVPAFTWSHQFTLPADCLRMIAVWPSGREGHSQAEFVKEENRILSDYATLDLQYIKKMTDPNRFSPLFTDCLTYMIASKLAIPMAESSKLQSEFWMLYERRLKAAAANDGMQSKTKMRTGSRLLESRLRNGRGF